ncbi:LOW QUALITY PROTEIN: cytochrome b561 and DOMON domain-containing protein At5g35735-like [Salvia miltiorrhiza]|uniref:LOW QUALITY PROTEIN: cytochrome b561 and DOMON domain-containing protein At5g35735-like n=1 Tax=Salvia miltiorrhiza TaxID=226208 RepID=UPI0025AC93A7|nr:LOW QUALITY PROTEIN: cytochrome b561 and DOMON domain-containing protein At5g35735-like [Salvia miltiorrhiza]
MGSFPPKTALFSAVFIVFINSFFFCSNAQTCSTFAFSNGRSYANCNALPVLDSFIHWNYHQANHTADIAYRHTQITSTNWVAWALNLNGSAMLGAQALVAFVAENGTVQAYTSPITSYETTLQRGTLSFAVPALTAEFVGDNQIIIYATINLPRGRTNFSHVWQHGDVSGNNLGRHPLTNDHRRSLGTIDFANEAATTTPAPAPENCPASSFSNGRTFSDCNALPVLGAFLHWNYRESNNAVDIAYRHGGVSRSSWVAWALNPTGNNMIGAQSLVAFFGSNGTLRAYTSPITSYQTTLQEAPLSFGVSALSAEFVGGNEIIIFATIDLSTAGTTRFTQVWQDGVVSGDIPQRHSLGGDNVRSIGSIDFATGATTAAGGAGGSRQRKRNVHGVLNVVSWGILMPMGAMAARYLKVFKSANPAWFYIHVTCQTSAYIVGVAGWGTGIKLGSDSAGVEQTVHRNIGIALFALGTLQVFALLLRPKPDHKYRVYWNIYHQGVGYAVIILSIVNIFEGLDILDPEKKWKNAYIGVLIFLGAAAALLEAFTWYIVLKRRRESDKQPHHQTNGVNGYHA